jgi:hypothetical protein
MSSKESFVDPTSQLFRMGEKGTRVVGWFDYLGLGLSSDDIPALVAIVTDPALMASADLGKFWAPVHAWRTLAQLSAVEVVDPMIRLRADWPDDELVIDDFPRVMEMVGRRAIPRLIEELHRSSDDPYFPASMAEGLGRIGASDLSARAECAVTIARRLEGYETQSSELNAVLVAALLDLQAVEHASLIERAMAAGAVEEDMNGDWEDVQIELGLLDARKTPKPFPSDDGLEPLPGVTATMPSPERRKREKAKKKSKRKLAKAARRRNRK